MNKVILIGRLVRDIELKTIGQSGTAVVNNVIAVSRYRQNQNGEKIEETSFIDIVFFNRYAEVVNQFLHKGSKLAVVGFLKQETWIDNNNQNRSRLVLVVEEMSMLDNKQDNQNNNQGNNYQNNNYQQNNYQKQPRQNQNNNYQQQNQSGNYQSNNYQQNDYGNADELPW